MFRVFGLGFKVQDVWFIWSRVECFRYVIEGLEFRVRVKVQKIRV